jgi:peroxiredoxin
VFMPDVALPSTGDTRINLRKWRGLVVVFVYPYTGRNGHANPPNWDSLPGAHGSTPQAIGYKTLYKEFRAAHATIFGLSFMTWEWQMEFVMTKEMPFELLSDEKREFSSKLNLRTFKNAGVRYLSRRTLVARHGEIILDRQDVGQPEQDAAEVLAWLNVSGAQ